ncbi:hypothetical protein LCGC14_2636320 [marine sediment metagenome]|uniref:Uncharacterized protein n=1 Tax=marine sediment metagenome TaxID=412755 RepID=A0A0F9CR56_9ZZZZ
MSASKTTTVLSVKSTRATSQTQIGIEMIKWIRTIDGELGNLDKIEAITIESNQEFFEIIAHIPSGRLTMASDFNTYMEASQFIRNKISPYLEVMNV